MLTPPISSEAEVTHDVSAEIIIADCLQYLQAQPDNSFGNDILDSLDETP